MTRPPKPSIEVMPYDDDTWEVFVDTSTGLNASLKITHLDDGNPTIVIDPESDHAVQIYDRATWAQFVAEVNDV